MVGGPSVLTVSLDYSLQRVVAEADEKAAQYDWMAAAELYEKAIDELDYEGRPAEKACMSELLANSYFKGAFQASNRATFKERMNRAASSCKRAEEHWERAGEEGLSKLSQAKRILATFWTHDTSEARGRVLERGISSAEKSVRLLERDQDMKGRAEARRSLLHLRYLQIHLDKHWREWGVQVDKTVSTADDAIKDFEILNDKEGLIDCLCTRVMIAPLVQDLHGRAIVTPRIDQLAERAQRVSRLLGTPYAGVQASLASAFAAFAKGDRTETLNLLKACRAQAEQTRDSLVIGRNLAFSSFVARWVARRQDDIQQRREILEEGAISAEEAIAKLKIPQFLLDLAHASFTDCVAELATTVETDADNKRSHLLKAIDNGERARGSEPLDWARINYSLGRAKYLLATIETDSRTKSQLLKSSLSLLETSLRATEFASRRSWDMGVTHNYLALIKTELAETDTDPRSEKLFLQSAVSEMDQCVKLCSEGARDPQTTAFVANYFELQGDVLQKLGSFQGQTELSTRALQAFENAIGVHTKFGRVTQLGGVRWKIARTYDEIGDYASASRAFMDASEDYRIAAKISSTSKDTFWELASYMEAWSIVEDAKFHHGEEEYALAAENYKQAADLLRSGKSWNHLSAHYMGCFFLEMAEVLSRQEKQTSSVESLELALKSLQQHRHEIETRLDRSPSPEEKGELEVWLRITSGRERYCRARAQVEKAKLLDMKGEDQASSTEFLIASSAFEALRTEARNERTRRELETLALSCKAWAKMKEAEIATSPSLYSEASSLFNKLENLTIQKGARQAAIANASVCKALESGARFRRTRDPQLYPVIKRCLETATDHFQLARLQIAAKWAGATGNLFDALVCLTDAAAEKDSKRKIELYRRSEMHLQRAAKLYDQAGFSAKSDEVLNELERVHEERDFHFAVLDRLSQNPPVTMIAEPVSLFRDRALGLERFEAANVVGNMSLHPRVLPIGSDATVEIEVANLGKTPATLTKLENITLEGLEVDRERASHRVEDDYIDMKGKRLEPMKTHEIKIPFRAKQRGMFEIRPRILFVDERGRDRWYDFEPVSITVKESGSSDWVEAPQELAREVSLVRTGLVIASKEFFRDEDIEARFEITVSGEQPVLLVAIENTAPNALSGMAARGGVLSGPLIDLGNTRLESLQVHHARVIFKPVSEGSIVFAPRLLYKDSSGRNREETFPSMKLWVYGFSPVMEFLARAFADDYSRRRLSFDQAGWRGLLEIVESTGIPKNQVYGDSRFSHGFGKGLDTLLKAGLVEHRSFPGKGRGGFATKVRARYEQGAVRRLVERLSSKPALKPLPQT